MTCEYARLCFATRLIHLSYWVVNTELLEFNVENMKSTVKPKHLQTAYDVAAEQHDLDYFKQLLQEFAAQAEEMEIAGADSASAKESKKASKSKAKSKVKADDDEDTEMPDADEEEPKTPATASAKSKSKKRKAEDDSKASRIVTCHTYPNIHRLAILSRNHARL